MGSQPSLGTNVRQVLSCISFSQVCTAKRFVRLEYSRAKVVRAHDVFGLMVVVVVVAVMVRVVTILDVPTHENR